MSSVEFRQIASGAGRRDGDRLFWAAISAFCSITRPSRNDVDQLEDLVMPLFDQASEKTLRFAAAALSECRIAPIGVVRALCHQRSDICAPLLLRCEALSEADLITLVSRHGAGHARIVARRKQLHPVVRDLLIALGDEETTGILTGDNNKARQIAEIPSARTGATASKAVPSDDGDTGAAGEMRARLRRLMTEREENGRIPRHVNDDTVRLAEKLRSTAFLSNPAFFQTALADALDTDFLTAQSITASASWRLLAIALKALRLADSEAFVIAFAVYPKAFSSPRKALDFLAEYGQLPTREAREKVRMWANGDKDMLDPPAADKSDITAPGHARSALQSAISPHLTNAS